jgi:hypothetical protein
MKTHTEELPADVPRPTRIGTVDIWACELQHRHQSERAALRCTLKRHPPPKSKTPRRRALQTVERNLAIISQIAEGAHFAAVARQFGLSNTRIHALWRRTLRYAIRVTVESQPQDMQEKGAHLRYEARERLRRDPAVMRQMYLKSIRMDGEAPTQSPSG